MQCRHRVHMISELEVVRCLLMPLHLLWRPDVCLVADVLLWHLQLLHLCHAVLKLWWYRMTMLLTFSIEIREEILHLLALLLAKQRSTRWSWVIHERRKADAMNTMRFICVH